MSDIIGIVMIMCTGCLNGGGQIRPHEGTSVKELVTQLETVYSSVKSVLAHIAVIKVPISKLEVFLHVHHINKDFFLQINLP